MQLLGVGKVADLGLQHVSYHACYHTASYSQTSLGQYVDAGATNLQGAVRA